MNQEIKNKFENFEPDVPIEIWSNIQNSILSNASASEPFSKASSISSGMVKVIMGIVAFVALVSTSIWYLNVPNTKETNKESVTEIANNESTPIPVAQDTELQNISNTTQNIQTNDQPSDKQTALTGHNVVEIPTPQPENKLLQIPVDKSNSKIVSIEGQTETCSGKIQLKPNVNGGVWTTRSAASIVPLSNGRVEVISSSTKPVVVYYQLDQNLDSVTLTFYQKAEKVPYKVIDATCSKNDGQIWIESTSNRTFSLFNSNQRNSLQNVGLGVHRIQVVDQYNCYYELTAEVRQTEMKSVISVQALNYIVDYPVYFKCTDIDEQTQVLWNFGDGSTSSDVEPMHRYKTAGNFQVELQFTKGNCSQTVNYSNLKIEDKNVSFANVFSPNNDNQNDIFKVSAPSNLKSFEAKIFNRSGQMVFHWSDSTIGWDGRLPDGQDAQSGTYYYWVKGVDSQQKMFEHRGFVELVR